MQQRDPISPADDRVLYISAHVAVEPSVAFTFFAEAARLERWLAPEAQVELRVGGQYELFWDRQDRENNSTIGCRITALAAGEFLAFQWRSPKQFKHFANVGDPLTHVVVAFCGDLASTRVHLVHSGWRSGPDWQEAAAWQQRAWEVAFRNLEKSVVALS